MDLVPQPISSKPSAIFAAFRSLLAVMLIAVTVTGHLHAEEISIELSVVAHDNLVTVSTNNRSPVLVAGLRFTVEVAGESYHRTFPRALLPGASQSLAIAVTPPGASGSYPIITRLYYRNDGVELSVVNVGYFNHREERILPGTFTLGDIELHNRSTVVLKHDSALRARLVLPAEYSVDESRATENGSIFSIRNLRPQFSQTADYFAVLETVSGAPATRVLSGRIYSERTSPGATYFTLWHYSVALILGLIFSLYQFRKHQRGSSQQALLLTRWSFGIFLISFFLLSLRISRVIPDCLLAYGMPQFFAATSVTQGMWTAITTILEWLYFNGPDYDYFFRYLADPLFLYFILGHYFVLRYLIRPEARTDKYWHLIRTTFSLPLCRKKDESFYWSKLTKVALLALLVKAFYVPLLASWTINNIFHQASLVNGFVWNFHFINKFLVAAFILLDVAIFTFGYLTELPQLKNQIKSVESTISGWVVCLICYPPFNVIIFLIFDEPLRDHFAAPPVSVQYLSVLIVTVLWGIYVWATVALGARSSNLTNRGIIANGPYRYIRHPAYASKVLLWLIEGAFLGMMNLLLVGALLVIYYLRSITEERHLKSDPEYRKYCEAVPFRFIPGVI